MVLNTVISRLTPQMTNAVMRRAYTYGPPVNKISFGEKCLLFSGASVIIAGPMFYIIRSLRKFQGIE